MNRSGDCHYRVTGDPGLPAISPGQDRCCRCDTVVTLAGHAGETGIAPSQVCTQRAPGPRAGRPKHEPVTDGPVTDGAAESWRGGPRVACLAGCTWAEPKTSPFGPATPSGPAMSPPVTVAPGTGTAAP